MLMVDTNVLVFAANAADRRFHDTARHALQRLVRGEENWHLTWHVVYEFLRVVTHPKVFARPLGADDARTFVAALLRNPFCTMLGETPLHEQVLTQCLHEAPRVTGNLFHDLRTAVIMREHGVDEVFTADIDFRSFPWVRVRLLTPD